MTDLSENDQIKEIYSIDNKKNLHKVLNLYLIFEDEHEEINEEYKYYNYDIIDIVFIILILLSFIIICKNEYLFFKYIFEIYFLLFIFVFYKFFI